jgi:exopolyphosphatase/pppGpp-phosphohydrolase
MKLAVIDTGTKATRLLIGDTEQFRADGFAFEQFRNDGGPTDMGRFLAAAPDEPLPLAAADAVIEAVRRYREQAVAAGVRHCVAVGTAVWRLAANVEDLRRHVREETGLDVQVLTHEEEAEYSFLAAEVSCRPFFRPGDGVLHLDQGGGSTEVIAGRASHNAVERHGMTSLDLGTVRLRNWFLADADKPALDCYTDARVESELELQRHDWRALAGPLAGRPMRCFGVGSALMLAAGRPTNRLQHGARLGPIVLQGAADLARSRSLPSDGRPLRAVLDRVETSEQASAFFHDLDLMLGLPVYVSILRRFALDELTVCGTGLRYGIFFAQALGRGRLCVQEWPV